MLGKRECSDGTVALVSCVIELLTFWWWSQTCWRQTPGKSLWSISQHHRHFLPWNNFIMEHFSGWRICRLLAWGIDLILGQRCGRLLEWKPFQSLSEDVFVCVCACLGQGKCLGHDRKCFGFLYTQLISSYFGLQITCTHGSLFNFWILEQAQVECSSDKSQTTRAIIWHFKLYPGQFYLTSLRSFGCA